MGLLSLVAVLMTAVGYLTFGFTETVCGRPPTRFHSGSIDTGSVIIHGFDYDLSKFNHPKTANVFQNGSTNPLFEGNWDVAGNDISFMFQKVNQKCLGIVTKASNSTISGDNGNVDWYFPCNVYSQHGDSQTNFTNYGSSETCHITSTARNDLATLHPQGQVYYTWDDVKNSQRNLAVFES
jgi:chitin synthase